MKRVFGILVLLVVCVLAYGWWKNHVHDKALNDGEVACDGCMSPERTAIFLKENAGEDADGQKEHKTTRGNISADEKGGPVASTTTVATTPAATTTTTTTNTAAVSPITPMAPYAPAAKETVATTTTTTAVKTPAATTTSYQTSSSAKTPAGAPPTYDTVAPNAPNGALFTGSGAYQWYRQGNLTWRVDSKTGRSCIVFATDEEWRKERVMSHGCGKSA